MTSNSKIARNTLFLYFRLLFTLGVTLYAVRVVLNALGTEEFGVYTVVGGIVALFSFLPGTMASATQRYFSFALGANDKEKLRTTFTVNWVLYGAIAVVAFMVLESGGLWYVSNRLNVPADRLDAVIRLYHFSVTTFIVGIFTSPFMAILIAHEDMKTYAYISIGDALMKLTAAFLLVQLPWDKLPLYGALLLTVSVCTAVAYITVCMRRYEECQFRVFHYDSKLLKEIIGFTGWTLFGQLTTVVRNHAVTILLNQTFNPVVVAARAIALNVGGHTNMFSQNFNVSLYPPIVKSYAAGKMDEMFGLVFAGSKITFFLMWIFALPLFIEMEFVLNVWLKNPPAGTVLFARLALMEALILAVSLPLTTAARAPGKMRFYELSLGAMQLAIFPISWMVLKLGHEPWAVFVVAIVINVLMFFVRLLIVRSLIGMSARAFLARVLGPVCIVVVLSSACSFATDWMLPKGGWFSCLSVFCSLLFTGALIYSFGLDSAWKLKIREKVAQKLLRKER